MKRLFLALTLIALASTAHASVISDGGLVVDIRDDNGSISSVAFNGIEFYQRGFFVSDFGFQLGSDTGTFALNDANGSTGISVAVATGANTVTVTGVYEGIQFDRVYTLSGGNTLHIDTTVVNASGLSLTLLAFDSADPDQGIDNLVDFNTVNDINGSSASATNVDTVTWVNPGSGVLTFVPSSLGIFDGSTLNGVLAAPYDPNGLTEDIGVAIIFQQALNPGESASFGYSQVFAPGVQPVPEPASLAVFGALLPLGIYVARRRKAA